MYMKETSRKVFKTFFAIVLIIIFILVVIVAVMGDRDGTRASLSEQEEQEVVDALNDQAAQYPPFVEQRASLVERLNMQAGDDTQ
jgi:Na+-transporting methylmalonyl-CoA/oxaloacetate decarboxylase gamma subunit